ncbi:MAG TPA: hypothetical protein VGI91_13225 [Steroidobacteraceae bacterium]|jgi:uncharacterized protein YqgV (UPF0045/DUF77 family)
MDIGVEISLYPLQQEYAPDIKDFIRRLQSQQALRIVTNSMSTQVFGPYEAVLDALRSELRVTLESIGDRSGKAVFVMKVLGPLAPA